MNEPIATIERLRAHLLRFTQDEITDKLLETMQGELAAAKEEALGAVLGQADAVSAAEAKLQAELDKVIGDLRGAQQRAAASERDLHDALKLVERATTDIRGGIEVFARMPNPDREDDGDPGWFLALADAINNLGPQDDLESQAKPELREPVPFLASCGVGTASEPLLAKNLMDALARQYYHAALARIDLGAVEPHYFTRLWANAYAAAQAQLS